MATSFVRRAAFLFGLIITFLLVVIESAPYVISDDRVRSLDITPSLGRGYSIMTNSFQSTCLMVEQTTVPSYNYDCECYETQMDEMTN